MRKQPSWYSEPAATCPQIPCCSMRHPAMHSRWDLFLRCRLGYPEFLSERLLLPDQCNARPQLLSVYWACSCTTLSCTAQLCHSLANVICTSCVLCCAVLCCAVLCCAVLCGKCVLCCAVLACAGSACCAAQATLRHCVLTYQQPKLQLRLACRSNTGDQHR